MQYDDLWKQFLTLAAALSSLFGVGVVARRVLSKDARDRAKNETEEDWFSTALGETKIDRDNWRKSAEQAWQERGDLIRERDDLRHQLRNERQLLRAHRKLVLKHCPELHSFLPSEAGSLDDDPIL